MATSVEIGSLRNFIDGESVDPADGRTDEIVNPATGETIAQAPSSGPEDVDRAVKAARAAFDGERFRPRLSSRANGPVLASAGDAP